MQTCLKLSSSMMATAVAWFCSALILCGSVEGVELTPRRYSQHEYERFNVNTMTYQAAQAACRHRGGHLDIPVLLPKETHYRWSGVLGEMLEDWHWAPMSREAGDTWRWWNGSLVDLSGNDTEMLRTHPTSSHPSCAVWRLNYPLRPASCELRHAFMCLRETSEWCRMRAYNKTRDQVALDWDGLGYPHFDSLQDVASHFVQDDGPVLYSAATGGRNLQNCKEACEDIHANETLSFGCWFSQHYRTKRISLKDKCVLLLAPSFPSVLYDVVPKTNTAFLFRTCFFQYLYMNDSCWLECNCRKSSAPATIEEAKAEDKKIKAELTVPTGNLSATVRRKTSATDPRPSAQGMGWLGVSFASALLVAVFILDVTSLKRDLGTLVSNVKDIFSGTKTTQ